MRKTWSSISSLCLFLSAGVPVFSEGAAGQPTETEQERKAIAEVKELLNIKIISVSKVAERPIDAPGLVNGITRAQVKQFGWTSLDEVMTALPGFSPSQDYDRRTVSARGVYEGWNNDHVLQLVDGVPMNDNIYGTAFTWEVTPLFLAKSLEIMRGPGSALYGSNAVNGVASINTVTAEDIAGGGEAKLRFGQRGTRSLDFLSGGSGDLVSFVVGYSNQGTHGNEYDSPDGSGATRPDGSLLPQRLRDRRDNDYFFAKLEGLLDLDGLSLQFHQQRWSFDTGFGWLFYVPDLGESMNEKRQALSLRYAKELGPITQEYVVRYQVHHLDWNTRYAPNGATLYGITYPAGLTEYLKTSADEWFVRGQGTYKFGKDGHVIVGLEAVRFSYMGDRTHFANADLNYGGSYSPAPDGSATRLQGFLQWTEGLPVLRTAIFAQLSSGKLVGDRLSITAGLRYDRQSSDFNALDRRRDDGSYPQESLHYGQASPRLGILFHGSKNYTFKVLIGRAFRTPSPAETFGANTYALASNIRQLKPETADTIELASDWILNRNFNWRINAFQTKTKNIIGYSPTNANLSTNLYTLTTRGMESELLWATGSWSGFLNLSLASRVDESILDPTILVSKEVTWVPSRLANIGVTWKSGAWSAAASFHYQGSVERRDSDSSVPAFAVARPRTVGSWTRGDLKASYRVGKFLELEAGVSNALESKGTFAKNFQYPFDYRIDPRTVWLGLRVQ